MPHRHKIPDVIEPSDDISICVPLPNHPDYIAAFLFALKQMTLDRYWQHTEDLAALTVRQVIADRTLKPVLDLLASGVWCGDSDDCIEYPSSNDDVLSYAPQNPFTQPGFVPDGYLLPPFTRFADIVPDFLPDWFAGLLVSLAEGLTGYDANDVLITIGSIPLTVDFDDLLTDGLPKITVTVSGKGRLLLHLLNVPFGGRALISVDVEFNPIDIINGLFNDGFRLVELERDYSSVPPELDIDHIEEIEFDEDGEHTVYITFLPVLDDALVPLLYGGGIRKIEWCGKDVTDVTIDCDYIQDCFEANPDNVARDNIVMVQVEQSTQDFLDELENQYTDSPQDINPLIPDALPNAGERNALCHAIGAWVRLYCEAKKSEIRQASFLSQAWNAIQTAIVNAYGLIDNTMGFIIGHDLFSCFVSNSEALAALSDETAIENLICCLYDELSGITLLQGSLEGALNACSGNDLVCLILNDLNLQHELNFFYIYGRTLERQNGGEIFECDCEVFDRMYIEYDFTVSSHGFTSTDATWQAGVGWVGNITQPSSGNYRAAATIVKQFPITGKIFAGGMVFSAVSNCGIEEHWWFYFLDGIAQGGRQVGNMPNADDYHITFSNATSYAPEDFDEVRFRINPADCDGVEPHGKGVISKARIWLDGTSAIKGIPSDNAPTGLPAGGSTSMDYWQ